jgi:hypothetical protein
MRKQTGIWKILQFVDILLNTQRVAASEMQS